MDFHSKPPHHATWLAHLAAKLHQREEAHLLRRLNPIDSAATPEIILPHNGTAKRFIQFASNNYLGLATDPEVIEAAREATAKWGAGSGASRLVSGSLAIHHELEHQLARFKHAQAALLFPSGFMANLAALTTFAGEGDLIVSDKLNHASLIDAALYSGAAHRTFPHGHLKRARALLSRDDSPPPKLRLLVTDTVFSMDGDTADLPALATTARELSRDESPVLLITDEAHATGVLGPTGSGLAELQNAQAGVAISVGTLSKALGSIGGFITGPRVVIDTLLNEARPFIYTTALPPAASAAALAALRIIQREPQRRERLLALSRHVRRELEGMGYNCGPAQTIQTPINPVILGDSEKALQAAAFLRDRGLFIPAIRPPTVAPNSARLRLSLMATHTDAQVEKLLHAMRESPSF